MRRTRLLVLATIIAATALWCLAWGKNSGHRFGDPLLAHEMMYAGEFFVQHGWATFGLPVYRPGAQPYTHLTPGPEWMQAVFAISRVSSVPRELWHSMATAALSIACLFWIMRTLRALLSAVRPASGGEIEPVWCGVALIGATPAFLLYSAHPYCAGMLLANAIVLAAASAWASAPDPQRWPVFLTRFALAISAAFWLGAAPLVSGTIWMLAVVWRFGERDAVRRRVVSFVLTAVAVVAVCTLLKFMQAAALFGSWSTALDDARAILERRVGGVTPRPLGESFPLRILYLYGLGLPLLVWLGWRNRARLVSEWPLLCAFGVGGLAWQVVMRGHAAYHIYMLRELMVPLALAVALLSSFDSTGRSVRVTYYTSLAEVVGTVVILIVPLVIAGEPLWRFA